jgi:hypothetical protein
VVLRKANAPLEHEPRAGREFVKRVKLLQSLAAGARVVLCSSRLVSEYREQVKEPRNDFVRLFFALLDTPRARLNWPRWSGQARANRHRCRFPKHDEHVLRTAWLENEQSVLFTEEGAQLASRDCIRRAFGVEIADPVA